MPVAAAVPLAMMAVKGVAGMVGAHQANQANAANAAANNQYNAGVDAAKKKVLDMITGSGVDLMHPQYSTGTTQTGQSSSTTRQAGITDARANFTPEGQAAYNAAVQAATSMPTALTPAQKAQQLNAARSAGDAATAAIQNRVAATGGGAPGMSAALGQQGALANNKAILDTIAGFDTTDANLAAAKANAANAVAGTARGTTTAMDMTSSTNSMSTLDSLAKTLGMPDVNSLLALLSPTAPQQTGKTGYNSLVGGIGDLAGAVGQYFAGQPGAAAPMQIPMQRNFGSTLMAP